MTTNNQDKEWGIWIEYLIVSFNVSIVAFSVAVFLWIARGYIL